MGDPEACSIIVWFARVKHGPHFSSQRFEKRTCVWPFQRTYIIRHALFRALDIRVGLFCGPGEMSREDLKERKAFLCRLEAKGVYFLT